MSVETDIENLRHAVTLLIEGQRIETSKRKNLETLALALHEAVLSQHESNNLLRDNQSNLETKLAALVDAQIHTEHNQANLEAKFNALVDAQIRTETHFSQLAATVQQLAETVNTLAQRNGHDGT